MRKRLTATVVIMFLFASILQSCNDKTEKSIQTQTLLEGETALQDTIPKEFKSAIRLNQKIILGETYTDTVEYINYNDEGDDLLFIVKKNKDSIYLINAIENDFVRGDVLEIQWRIDSIRYAGDESFLDFREYLIKAKKIKSLQLADKNSKFLWRETVYDKDLATTINTIVLNEEYIKNISDPEKAALAYVATAIGNECEWDGNASEDRSNLKCKILWALNLGYQCSSNHLEFLRYWFRNNKTILKEFENCGTTPDGATIQDTFDEINIKVEGNFITISFNASGSNMREGKSWNWTEKQYFEFKNNELLLLKKDISPIKHSDFEVRGN